MNIPEELLYSKSHEWVQQLEDGKVRVGISDYAQSTMGDLVFVNLPAVGDSFTAGDVFADVESVKAVSDIYAPVTGTVSAVNEALLTAPEEINSDPYGAWMVEFEDATGLEDLLSAQAYEAVVEAEEH